MASLTFNTTASVQQGEQNVSVTGVQQLSYSLANLLASASGTPAGTTVAAASAVGTSAETHCVPTAACSASAVAEVISSSVATNPSSPAAYAFHLPISVDSGGTTTSWTIHYTEAASATASKPTLYYDLGSANPGAVRAERAALSPPFFFPDPESPLHTDRGPQLFLNRSGPPHSAPWSTGWRRGPPERGSTLSVAWLAQQHCTDGAKARMLLAPLSTLADRTEREPTCLTRHGILGREMRSTSHTGIRPRLRWPGSYLAGDQSWPRPWIPGRRSRWFVQGEPSAGGSGGRRPLRHPLEVGSRVTMGESSLGVSCGGRSPLGDPIVGQAP